VGRGSARRKGKVRVKDGVMAGRGDAGRAKEGEGWDRKSGWGLLFNFTWGGIRRLLAETELTHRPTH